VDEDAGEQDVGGEDGLSGFSSSFWDEDFDDGGDNGGDMADSVPALDWSVYSRRYD
jgi:hypothetical protein